MASDKEMHDRQKVVACDLDGTLAHYCGWVHHADIGAPIPEMVAKVKTWLSEGKVVYIFTARMSANDHSILPEIQTAIENWCRIHVGQVLPITGRKLLSFSEIHDDRARRIVPNIGVEFQDELINRFALANMEEPWLIQALDSLRLINKELHKLS